MSRPKPLSRAAIVSDRTRNYGRRIPIFLFQDNSGSYRWYSVDQNRNYIPTDVEGISIRDAKEEAVRVWRRNPHRLKASWFPGNNSPLFAREGLSITVAAGIVMVVVMITLLWYSLIHFEQTFPGI